MSLFEYLEYSRIIKERERNIISKTENRQTTNKHTDVRNKDTSYTYIGQSSTDKDDRTLRHKLMIPFPVWAGIKINSSRNRKWNYENILKF